MELASLVRDILRQRHVERLAQHREQDNEAEAEWRSPAGGIAAGW